MEPDHAAPKKRRSIIMILIVSFLVILVSVGIFLYFNFNRLLSEALLKSFDSSIISEVYELKFENLRVNLLDRNIRVINVTLVPREKPAREYPYINSSFRLTTKEILLDSVHLRTLLRENKLIVKRIQINKPDIELMLAGKRHIMLPFKDSTEIMIDSATVEKDNEKISKDPGLFRSFALQEFQLYEAAFHVVNNTKQREFTINNFSISLKDLLINQYPGQYTSSVDRVVITLGHLIGDMQQDAVRHLSFKGFNIGIDSLKLQLSLDTMIHRFTDFSFGLRDLDVQTADSLVHITMKSFITSYKNKSIKLQQIGFQPNFSHDVLQRKEEFQKTGFSGTIGKLEISQLNFDSLIYARKLLVGSIALDQVNVSLFKDKTKPLDKKRFPAYLGQTVRKIPLPIHIGQFKATNVQLESNERKPDSTLAKVTITRGTIQVKNFTNLNRNTVLTMSADAWLMGKARFSATLDFYYSKPQFDFEGKLGTFDLSTLSPLISAYTPAKISSGITDEISFSGTALETSASGTMKFLYHDLDIDLAFKNAAWANSIVAFAANTILESSNPPSADAPPRIVKFQIERDMNKGFVNVLIKSLLNGLKETMIMSKENRKAYKKEAKKTERKKKK